MSLLQYGDVLKKSKLSKDHAGTQTVRNVGKRITQTTEEFFRENGMTPRIEKYRWKFNLIEDDETGNAWRVPGGKVAVYTGIVPIAQNMTWIAVVMGHKFAHAIAKYGNERRSIGLLALVG
jgi:predicted Zn-dependent protease